MGQRLKTSITKNITYASGRRDEKADIQNAAANRISHPSSHRAAALVWRRADYFFKVMCNDCKAAGRHDRIRARMRALEPGSIITATPHILIDLGSLGLPLPGESLLIVAAILAGAASYRFSVCSFSVAGAVLGDNIGY